MATLMLPRSAAPAGALLEPQASPGGLSARSAWISATCNARPQFRSHVSQPGHTLLTLHLGARSLVSGFPLLRSITCCLCDEICLVATLVSNEMGETVDQYHESRSHRLRNQVKGSGTYHNSVLHTDTKSTGRACARKKQITPMLSGAMPPAVSCLKIWARHTSVSVSEHMETPCATN